MMEILEAVPQNLDDLERYCADARKLGAGGATKINVKQDHISMGIEVATANAEPSSE